MEIKELKPVISRAGNRYVTILLSDGRGLRGDPAVASDLGLYVGLELTQDDLERLIERCELSRVQGRALRILGSRQMSRRELIRRLREKGEDEDIAEAVAEKLEELGLIDDEEYGKAVARYYITRGYGLDKIRSELYRRGIPRELWEEALEEYDDETSELDNILYRRHRGEFPPEGDLRKTRDFLRRRGFSWDEITDAIKRYREEYDED
jgi:regulatory protein